MKTACINCHFGTFAHLGASRGECRRAAPKTTIGQLEPDVRYGNPEMAAWPGVMQDDFCGEFQLDAEAPLKALRSIVREQIFGDGTADCQQRVIDLCIAAERRFEIKRGEG